MFKIGKKKDLSSSIALDIGTQYIKILELEPQGQAFRIKNYKILNLVSEGKRFLPKEISRIIKKTFSDLALTSDVVRSSVSGKSLIVRHVDLPKMSKQELKSSLRYQADLHIPFNLEEAYYDAHIISPPAQADARMKVLIVAIKQKDAEETIDVIKKAQFSIDLITVDSIALFNAFYYGMSDAEKGETIALVDIGASKTTINIVEKGVSVLCREIKYGGIKFTEMIMEGMSISFDEAEKKKIAGDDAILPFAAEAYKPLVRDIRASFDYFEGMMGASVQKVYCSGGGALSRGITDFLKEKLSLQAILWNPLRKLDDSVLPEKETLITSSPLMAISLGIAISPAGDA